MELRGVGIDLDAHDALCDKWGVDLAEARRGWSETTGEPPPSKTADIVRYLARVLPEAELSKWPRTDTGGLTTRTSELKRVAHLPAIQPLLRIKEVEQRITHFGSKLRQLVNPETGRLHPHYNVAGTKAGRWSASDPNVQQLPHDQAIRSIIVTASGNVLIGADYSQMELRAIAWFSGDSGMTRAFERGDDLHVLTAAAINGIDPAQVTTEQRTSAKAANFGLIYGSGPAGLAASAWNKYGIAMTVEEAAVIRTRFFARYSGLQPGLDVSGPIATVVAGLLSGNITGPRLSEDTTAPLRTFWWGLDEMLNALLFVFVGFHVVLINPLAGVIPGVPGLVAITAVLFARALAVAAIVGGLNAVDVIRADCLGLTKLLTWGGLRGALSLALAVSLPDSSWKPLTLNMTFAVVVFSIVVQGLTIDRMFTKDQLAGMLRS